MNYEQAMEYIHAVQWAGHKPGLTRTRTLLAALGDPHKKLQFVHVAGTNGKGSTAALLASCLQAAGYRVGLYTSPFINRFNERIQINGQQTTDEALVELVEQVKPAADAMEDVPSEFEIITALGMLYFAQQQCDIVVLEVGLGGTLDSTNVIEKPACAVITALGMDHVKELGPTLADIAAAKAGIIKPGGAVVSCGGCPEADAVIRQRCREQGAALTEVDFTRLQVRRTDLAGTELDFVPYQELRLPLGGLHKAEVREIAEKQHFINARKHDSQDICFVPDGDYARFMEDFTGKHYPAGDFLDENGKKVGTHNGAVRYTIGQRKGLGLAMGAPVYVCAKDMQANTVTVGPEENLFDRIVYADEVNWIAIPELTAPLRVTARTRYHQTEQAATVYPAGEGKFRLEFDQPQRAPTPGQAVVLYQGDTVLGGGTITRVEK